MTSSTSRFVSLASLVILSFITTKVYAEEPQQTRWSLATDISPWFFSGYSALAMVEPAGFPLRFSGEVWGFQFPEAYIELNDANVDEGWSRRVDVGMALYADWHFTPEWHAGVVLNVFRSTVSRENISGEASFWSGEVLARMGYRWIPWDDLGFFLNPWLSAGPVIILGDDVELGGEYYDETPIQVIGTIHTGWRF